MVQAMLKIQFNNHPNLHPTGCDILLVCLFIETLGSNLPLVDSAVSSSEGVALGILKSVQDGLVFGVEVHSAMLNRNS